MKSYLKLIVVFNLLLIGCGNENGKKSLGNKIPNQNASAPQLVDTPKSLKEKTDSLIDSVFIPIPSEGTVIKKYKKNNSGLLYISSSYATLKSIYYEILTKGDSMIVLKKIEKYNKPLTRKGAEIVTQSNEYMIFVNGKLRLYTKNDSLINKTQDTLKKITEIKSIIKKINSNKN